MLFIRLGRIAAWILLIVGTLKFLLGASVIFMVETMTGVEGEIIDRDVLAKALQARYLVSTTPGEAIDKGALIILSGIALGILVQVGRSASTNVKIDRRD